MRVNLLAGPVLSRCHHAGAERHFAMRQRGAVLYHQHAPPANALRVRHRHTTLRLDHRGKRVDAGEIVTDGFHGLPRRGVDLVDHQHVGAAKVHLAGVVTQLVADAERVRHYDFQVGAIERRVVIAAVPQDQLCLPLRLPQDRLIVHTGVDYGPLPKVRLVLLPLLDGALLLPQILHGGETLDPLLGEVAVRHGMTHHHQVPPEAAQFLGHAPRYRALAAAGADCANRNHRNPRRDLGALGAQQPEVGSRGHGARRQVHHGGVSHVTVGKYDRIHVVLTYQLLQPILRYNGNTLRVKLSCQLPRIGSVLNVRDLRGREGHHLKCRVAAETTLKLWKSLPAAPRITILVIVSPPKHGIARPCAALAARPMAVPGPHSNNAKLANGGPDMQ